jgi:hypothetical protein
MPDGAPERVRILYNRFFSFTGNNDRLWLEYRQPLGGYESRLTSTSSRVFTVQGEAKNLKAPSQPGPRKQRRESVKCKIMKRLLVRR